MNVTVEQGLFGLLAAGFLSATLLPGGSEALLWGFLQLHPEQTWVALFVATLGNTLGGLTTYGCGRLLPKWRKLAALPHSSEVQRWGCPILLLAWLPVIGDALCLAAGWLRLHWLHCTVMMAIGKFIRYGAIAWAL